MQKLLTTLKTYLKNADILLLILAITASLLGLLVVFSATRSFGSEKFVFVQAFAIALGAIGFIIASMIDFDRLGSMWKIFFVLNLLFQLSLLVLGESGDSGNQSWIRFAGIGVQPGEMGKIIFIFTFARHLYELRDRINRPLSVLMLLLHAGLITGAVLFASKDLGMSISYLLIFVIMIFAAGLSIRWLSLFAVCAAALSPIVWKLMDNYQRLRILVVFDPSLSEKYAYQAKQGMTAIGSGQLFGSGFLQGRFTQSASALPAKHTDFIFAAGCEELGFIFAIVCVTLLSAIVLRIFYDSAITTSHMGRLMCIGIGGMIMVQSMINIGMCMGVMPVIGLTLPFFSYGGTSIMVTIVALGIVCGFTMRLRPNWLR